MKTICIKVDAEFFRNLKTRIAETGKTVQEYMHDLIEQDLYPMTEEDRLENVLQIRTEIKEIDEILKSFDESFAEQEDRLRKSIENNALEQMM